MSSTLRGTIVLCSCLRKRGISFQTATSCVHQRHIFKCARADVGVQKIFSVPARAERGATRHTDEFVHGRHSLSLGFLPLCPDAIPHACPFLALSSATSPPFLSLGVLESGAQQNRTLPVLRLPSFQLKDVRKELLQLLGGSISVELPLKLLRRGAGGIWLLLTGSRHQLRL